MIYRFAGFELDDEQYELRRGGSVLSIPRKSFDLLRYLLSHAGRVVSKEELFAELWPQEHVTDSVLPVNVRTIRKALNEDPPQSIIRTVRGRGYCITCSVERSHLADTAPVARSQTPTLLVGRTALLEELRSEFQATRGGRAATAMLCGEAGIGKTRVLLEFTQWAQRQGTLVLHARGEHGSGAPPFWMLAQLLREAGRALESGAVAGLDPERIDLPRARAQIRALLEERGGPEAESLAFRISRAVIQLARSLCKQVALVLVLDDLHSADRPSLEIFGRVLRGLSDEPLFVLGAHREVDLDPAQPLSDLLGALATHPLLRQIDLRGLCEASVGEFVRQDLTQTVSPAFVHGLHERTQGNPFFLRELLREGMAGGDGTSAALPLDAGQIPLPRAIRASIELRLRPLSTACNQALTWAAVIGTRFSFTVLEQVSGIDGPALLEPLREAARAHLIGSETLAGSAAHARSRGEYGFTHPLIRETLYARLSSPERILRHRAVGEALERAGNEPELLSALARHFFEASPGGDIDRTSEYCMRAARQALSRSSHAEAIEHLEHALGAETLRVPRDRLRMCCIQLALGDALRRAGQQDASRRTLLRAAELARELARPDLIAYAALGLGKETRRSSRLREPLRLEELTQREHRNELLALADEALGGLDDGQLALRARLLAMRSQAESGLGRRVPETQSDAPIHIARKSQSPRALFDALLAKRAALPGPPNAERALPVADELMEVALKIGARPLMFAACEARIPTLLGLAQTARADEDIAFASELASALHSPAYDLVVTQFQLGRKLGDGDLDGARKLLARAIGLAQETENREIRYLYESVRLWLASAEGKGLMERPTVEGLRERGQFGQASAHALVAHYFWAVGDRRQSVVHFEQAAEHDFADIRHDEDWLWNLCTCADVAARLRDHRRAKRLYALISPHALVNVTCCLHLYRGSASHILARLATILGDVSSARAHFEVALEFNRRIGASPSLLLTQYHFGRMLLKGHPTDRERGQTLLIAAAKGAEQMGLGGLLRRSDLRRSI